MITINNLKKQFGETCACDIPSFTINDGDILGLVGNNGAGKTTLFRLLLDLLQADGGSVSYILPSPLGEGLGGEAINPAESEAWKKDVGAYIDDGFLIDFLTPEEYFAFLGKISGMTQEDVDQRLEA
jgi:ABC-2 type transport system ATP-binding protein